MDRLLHKVEAGIEELMGRESEKHSHTADGNADCDELAHAQGQTSHRYQSFAPQTFGHPKWYVDGCSYFWAVSEALERAQRSIYILDWWLSPELYLRRPPAQNEQYRLDNMLRAAAERGVEIRVIVYKEVPQALTLNSAHTKHHLEALHPNIRVFRHPDHLPRGHDIQADFESAFQNLSLGSLGLSKLGKDALKTLYGTSDDVVLYWAHHEKLCVVDGHVAFMGGLDMCFGRWDTNSHPIADAHPSNLDAIIFPGQDYNNARVYDFADVDKWENNKLDRTKSSRMGWSDISISLSGPIVSSLVTHFLDRWNYIFSQKYITRGSDYAAIELPPTTHHVPSDGENWLPSGLHRHFHHGMRFLGGGDGRDDSRQDERSQAAQIQLTRSCTQWSAGHPTEHSIANAYMAAIAGAERFVYMENQFFITATSDEQHPVENKIGRAMVDRIVRAHASGDGDFCIIVCIPAVPGFAGDLQSDGALGTRAIMEFQYNSISRGEHSIYAQLRAAGVDDPEHYLRFYNLRNYDRINTAPALLRAAEQASGVSYGDARREFDDAVESGYDGYRRDEDVEGRLGDRYQRYQAAAARIDNNDVIDSVADSVAACYMDGGPALQDATSSSSASWPPDDELRAFVSEELYIHSKVLIADDRLVICGSANLNDRSQLGSHDSEIAVVIEDTAHPVETTMAGQPFVANAFAASLRRQLFRKHLGLLPDQPCDRPTQNFLPVTAAPNEYDWDSQADRMVADPLSDEFRQLWTGTARTNTEAFDDVFHCVPTDRVRTWDDYDQYFSQYFVLPGADPDKDDKHKHENEDEGGSALPPGKTDYGHVVPGFPGGVEAVKARLSEVRGNLVEMPLQFLVDVEDLAKNGLSLNSLTDELYT